MKKIYRTPPLLLLLALFALVALPGCYVHHDDCGYCGAPPPPPPPPPCTYGPNGVSGPAFFGVDWNGVQPSYLWCNNTALPPVFNYGAYYNSYPGTFSLYYEGSFMDGCCPRSYYWNVDFVVWIHGGTYGGCGYAGVDGLPSYLMLILGPTGPGEVRTNKTALPGTTTEVIRTTDDETEILYTKGDINVLVTYKRLDASLKSSLNPKYEVKAGKK